MIIASLQPAGSPPGSYRGAGMRLRRLDRRVGACCSVWALNLHPWHEACGFSIPQPPWLQQQLCKKLSSGKVFHIFQFVPKFGGEGREEDHEGTWPGDLSVFDTVLTSLEQVAKPLKKSPNIYKPVWMMAEVNCEELRLTSWQYCRTSSFVPKQLLVPEVSGSHFPVWILTCIFSFPQNMAI